MNFPDNPKNEEAIETFYKALEADEAAEIKGEVAAIHFSLGVLLKKVGNFEKAKEHLNKAAELFHKGLVKYPNSAKVYVRLGDALAENGNFKQASEAFAQAVALNPFDPAIRMKLVQSLEFQGRIDEAIVALQRGFQLASRNKQVETAMKFEKYIEYLKYKKQQHK